MDNFANLLNGRCYLCDKGFGTICDRCLSKLTLSEEPFSMFLYNEYSSKILIKSKYPPYEFYLLKFLMRKFPPKLKFENKSILCPIPLSSLRFYERRFNQAELISDEISRIYKVETVPILKRISDTNALYLLNPIQRKHELHNVFKTNLYAYFYKGYSVTLVDDLKTTGQTFLEAERALKNFGFRNINYFSLFSASN